MRIWTDGAGSHLKGQRARYCVVFEGNLPVVCELAEGTTNNVAEYRALLAALEDARSDGAEILTDSRLVVGQVTEGWRVNAEHLRPLVRDASVRLRERRATLRWIPRKGNRAGKVLEALGRSGRRSGDAGV